MQSFHTTKEGCVKIDDPSDFSFRLREGLSPQIILTKISLTQRCNLKCKKCSMWRLKNPLDFPRDKLIDLIDGLSARGCIILNMTGGEPTLYDGLCSIIDYARDKGIKCGITSNGQLIDKNFAKNLARVRLKRIHISLDSIDPAVHDKIVCTNGAWERTVNAIKYISDYVPGRITSLNINHVLTKMNYESLPEFLSFASYLGVGYVKIIPYRGIDAQNHANLFKLTEDDVNSINKTISQRCHDICEKTGIQTNFHESITFLNKCPSSFFAKINSDQIKTPCFRPFYSMDITIHGGVYPCCLFIGEKKYCIGNIFKMPIDNIFYSTKHREFLRGLIPPIRYSHCRECWSALDDNLEILKDLDGYSAPDLLNKLCREKTA